MPKKIYAVSGATGQQGGSVAKALLDVGHGVRALTRKTDSPAAKALVEQGADVYRVEFEDPASLEAALVDVDGFFTISTPFEKGAEAETTQGIATIRAAQKAGIPFTVFSSVAGADRKTGVPHFDSKYKVEEYLAASGLKYAIVAPVFFIENTLAPFVLPGIKKGNFGQALPAEKKLQMISYQTIGRFAARVLTHPDEFAGTRTDIASVDVNGTEVAAILSEAIGRPIGYFEVPIDAVRQGSEDMALMYEWFDKTGYSADIEGLKKKYPEDGWTDFREWAGSVDWDSVLAG